MLIKKVFKIITALCVILACVSCQKQDNILIDLTGESDKVVKNTSGTLYHNKELKKWAVRVYFPGTIDSVDNYIITEMPDTKFTFVEGKQVSVSGFCYHIQSQILADKGIYYPAGTEYYYIKVTDLK